MMSQNKSFFILPLTEQAALSVLYTQPYRTYHNITHINELLSELYKFTKQSSIQFTKQDIALLTYMIWYHDAIYDPYQPYSGYNEELSAELFETEMTVAKEDATFGIDGYDRIFLIIEGIKATAKHTEQQSFEFYKNNDSVNGMLIELMLDIDLSGLGKPLPQYAKNSLKILGEYPLTSIGDYLHGRLSFLETINKRESFYYTEYFKNLYHVQSKENIKYEIALIKNTINDYAMDYIDERKAALLQYVKRFTEEMENLTGT